jgi:hypothetical protein
MDNNSKQEINTTHEFLIELNNKCPISLIMTHTKLSEKEIMSAIEGDTNIEIFEKLLSFWCWLESKEQKLVKIKDAISELEMSRAFDLSSRRGMSHHEHRKGV